MVVEVLELAAAAAPKMTARRNGMVRSGLHGAIGQYDVTRRRERDMTAAGRDAVTLCGDPCNLFALAHKKCA